MSRKIDVFHICQTDILIEYVFYYYDYIHLRIFFGHIIYQPRLDFGFCFVFSNFVPPKCIGFFTFYLWIFNIYNMLYGARARTNTWRWLKRKLENDSNTPTKASYMILLAFSNGIVQRIDIQVTIAHKKTKQYEYFSYKSSCVNVLKYILSPCLWISEQKKLLIIIIKFNQSQLLTND